jgi:hypothetical protein
MGKGGDDMLWKDKTERKDFIDVVEEAVTKALKDFSRWKVRFDEGSKADAGSAILRFSEGRPRRKDNHNETEGNYPTGKKRYDRSPP